MGSGEDVGARNRVTRRRFLAAASTVAATAPVAGCGFVRDRGPGDDPDTLTFTTWGTDAELAGFRALVDRFTRTHPGARVALNVVPFKNFFTNIDVQLQAGAAPDLFRVDYDTLGVYSGGGQLLDLSPYLAGGFGDRFTPAMWRAVRHADRPYGVPHHTDTSVLLYNTEMLRAAGITEVPRTLEAAWTWDEFAAVAQRLREVLTPSRFPFIVNWQLTGVTRWLTWLFEADGRFLAPDLRTPAIASPQGRAALGFTRSFFGRGFVPPSSSVKSPTYANDLWYAKTAAMTFGGAYLVPDAAETVDFPWGATFAPRHVRPGGEMGGNALVATAGTRKPALAAAFLDTATQHDAMRDFCVRASLLPTRADLLRGGLRFATRPELTGVFLDQASTVRPEDAAQVASPSMDAINTVLSDHLEEAFVGDDTTDDILAALSAGIAAATTRTG